MPLGRVVVARMIVRVIRAITTGFISDPVGSLSAEGRWACIFYLEFGSVSLLACRHRQGTYSTRILSMQCIHRAQAAILHGACHLNQVGRTSGWRRCMHVSMVSMGMQ